MSDLMMRASYEKEGFEESRIEWKLDADGNLVLSLSGTGRWSCAQEKEGFAGR